ncbi:hypothetical protein ACKQTC_09110 [Peptococcus simiae]|uniref:ATPase n=1 Tax=Peptococcus simiae TaxID=1643805 RepID=A0ABW9H459_9FIRM
MEILDLIDQLEDMVKNAKQPILNKEQVILEQEDLFAVIDGLRTNMPTAIQDAQWVKRDEERIIAAAQEEQDRIIAEAKDRARALVEQHEITQMATSEGEAIVNDARQQAHDIYEGAFNYAHDIMSKLENQLTVYYEVIQEGRSDIQKSLDAMKAQDFEIHYRPDDLEDNR